MKVRDRVRVVDIGDFYAGHPEEDRWVKNGDEIIIERVVKNEVNKQILGIRYTTYRGESHILYMQHIELIDTETISSKNCNCDIQVLCNLGCQCGGN